jgi:hypothetical protein
MHRIMHLRRLRTLITRVLVGLMAVVLVVAPGGWSGYPRAEATSNGACFEDGGLRVQICIWQDVGTDYVSGAYNYLQVTDYRFTVKNIGGSQVSVTPGSLTMRATVYGPCVSGCGGYVTGTTSTRTVSGLVSGQTYTLAIPWKSATIKIHDGNSIQAANAGMTYYFRGSKTSYQSPNLCIGAVPFFGGCEQ